MVNRCYHVCMQDIQELTQKLQSAEEYREKFLKFEADTDEMQDFAVQELAKVKHMVCLRPQLCVVFLKIKINLRGCGFVSHAVFIGWLGRFLYTSLGRGIDTEKAFGRVAYFLLLFFLVRFWCVCFWFHLPHLFLGLDQNALWVTPALPLHFKNNNP